MGEHSPDIYEALSYNPDTRCAGGKAFHECPAAEALTNTLGISRIIDGKDQSAAVKPNRLHTHAYLPVGCVACGAMCELSQVLAKGISGMQAQLRSMSPEVFDRTRAPILEKLARDALESLRAPGDQMSQQGDKNVSAEKTAEFDIIDSH